MKKDRKENKRKEKEIKETKMRIPEGNELSISLLGRRATKRGISYVLNP